MKFDFCIGNPPYQENRQGESNTQTPVYNTFMDAAYGVSDKTMLITPARFLFNAGYTPKDWNKKMLNDKLVSKGKMYYQQANKLRWEYITPYQYTFLLNDQKVQIKSGQRNSVIDVKQNKVFREIARIMMNSVVGKSLSDTKDFRVSIAESGTEWIATLLPQRKEMKQMFQKVILHFNKQRSMVSQVVMLEKNGDQTVIDLRNVKTNQPLNSSLFVIK